MQETQLQQKEILAEKKYAQKNNIDILHFNPRHFLANRRVLCWK